MIFWGSTSLTTTSDDHQCVTQYLILALFPVCAFLVHLLCYLTPLDLVFAKYFLHYIRCFRPLVFLLCPKHVLINPKCFFVFLSAVSKQEEFSTMTRQYLSLCRLRTEAMPARIKDMEHLM